MMFAMPTNIRINLFRLASTLWKLLQRKETEERERDFRYSAVMRALVWRYVSSMHRHMDDSPVTDDDINEVKGEITSMRYELLEVLERNGMDVSSADRKRDSEYPSN